MAIDARIPLMAEGLNLEPRSNALARGMQLQGVQQQNALRQMQMQQMQQAAQQQIAEREAAAMRQQQMDAELARLQPVRGINANRVSGIVGPRPEAAAVIGQRPQADPIALLRAGFDPKMVEFIVNSPNLGRAEVARVLERAGAGGRPESVQLDKFGQPVGQALPKAVEAKLMDLGGTKQAYDPYGLKPGQSFQTTMTPEGKDASARGWAGVNLQRERLNFDKGTATADAGGPNQAAFTRQFGKAAPGYRWKADGSQEAIPGGPADIKAGELGARRDRQVQASVAQANRVIEKVDSAIENTGIFSAGAGSVLADVPGLPARNLRSTLDTIKANLGFAELQAMRDASPTGGALGAIAVQELTALQSTVASLDQGQSPEKLRESLGQIKKHYEAWKSTVQQAAGTPPAAPPRLTMPTNPNAGAMDIFNQADAILRGGK
jgi:hypothetical protein